MHRFGFFFFFLSKSFFFFSCFLTKKTGFCFILLWVFFFFNVDSNFSTFTLQRFTNVQLYSQKYVPLLGYIIDTDQTSKQENTTNFYICKVYTKYTLYIYRSKTKAELDFYFFFCFFFLMLNNQFCVSPGEQRSGELKIKNNNPKKSSALKFISGCVCSKVQLKAPSFSVCHN